MFKTRWLREVSRIVCWFSLIGNLGACIIAAIWFTTFAEQRPTATWLLVTAIISFYCAFVLRRILAHSINDSKDSTADDTHKATWLLEISWAMCWVSIFGNLGTWITGSATAVSPESRTMGIWLFITAFSSVVCSIVLRGILARSIRDSRRSAQGIGSGISKSAAESVSNHAHLHQF